MGQVGERCGGVGGIGAASAGRPRLASAVGWWGRWVVWTAARWSGRAWGLGQRQGRGQDRGQEIAGGHVPSSPPPNPIFADWVLCGWLTPQPHRFKKSESGRRIARGREDEGEYPMYQLADSKAIPSRFQVCPTNRRLF